MIPILLRLGPFHLFGHPLTLTIYSYGLMMALGFIAADLVIAADCPRRGIDPEYATADGDVGRARRYRRRAPVRRNRQLAPYMADPITIIWSGSGFVWYGGFIGGVTAAYFVARHYKVSVGATADMCGPALAIGQALGRIGCHLSGDGDWGAPSTLPWAVAYPKAIVGWGPQTVLKLGPHHELVSGFFPGVRVHPTSDLRSHPVHGRVSYSVVDAPDGRASRAASFASTWCCWERAASWSSSCGSIRECSLG